MNFLRVHSSILSNALSNFRNSQHPKLLFTENQQKRGLLNVVFFQARWVQTGTTCSNTSLSINLVSILIFADQANQIIGQALFTLTGFDKTLVIGMLIFVMWVCVMGFPISSASSITPQCLASLNFKLFKFILFQLPKMIIWH